jgi:hypothetical protein
MLKHVQAYSGMFRKVQERSGAFRHVQTCSDMFTYVQIRSDMFRCVPICSDMFRYAQIFLDMFRYVQVCSDVFRYIQICSDKIRYFQICSDMFRYVQMCRPFYKSKINMSPQKMKAIFYKTEGFSAPRSDNSSCQVINSFKFKYIFKYYYNLPVYIIITGPGSSAGITTDYGLECPGIKNRWGARFSAHVKTDLRAH